MSHNIILCPCKALRVALCLIGAIQINLPPPCLNQYLIWWRMLQLQTPCSTEQQESQFSHNLTGSRRKPWRLFGSVSDFHPELKVFVRKRELDNFLRGWRCEACHLNSITPTECVKPLPDIFEIDPLSEKCWKLPYFCFADTFSMIDYVPTLWFKEV